MSNQQPSNKKRSHSSVFGMSAPSRDSPFDAADPSFGARERAIGRMKERAAATALPGGSPFAVLEPPKKKTSSLNVAKLTKLSISQKDKIDNYKTPDDLLYITKISNMINDAHDTIVKAAQNGEFSIRLDIESYRNTIQIFQHDIHKALFQSLLPPNMTIDFDGTTCHQPYFIISWPKE
jgi:hypothetical protein